MGEDGIFDHPQIKPDETELRRLRILAVDDEESNLLLLRRILELEGYTDIHVCSDAALVPEMFIRLAPDLVLLDLHMPKITGFELMERLAPLSGGASDVPFLGAPRVFGGDWPPEFPLNAAVFGALDGL